MMLIYMHTHGGGGWEELWGWGVVRTRMHPSTPRVMSSSSSMMTCWMGPTWHGFLFLRHTSTCSIIIHKSLRVIIITDKKIRHRQMFWAPRLVSVSQHLGQPVNLYNPVIVIRCPGSPNCNLYAARHTWNKRDLFILDVHNFFCCVVLIRNTHEHAYTRWVLFNQFLYCPFMLINLKPMSIGKIQHSLLLQVSYI